jgi:hypothetical protein
MLKKNLATFRALKSRQVEKIRPTLYLYNARHRCYFSALKGVIDLDDLLVYVHGSGFVSIDSTPHFFYAKYLNHDSSGNFSSYSNYIKDYYPSDDLISSQINFQTTMSYVEAKYNLVNILISANTTVPGKFTIVDGLHRSAIALAIGRVNIKCYIIF